MLPEPRDQRGPVPAVAEANAAIAAYLRSLPGRRARTTEQRAEYGRLLNAWSTAVARAQVGAADRVRLAA